MSSKPAAISLNNPVTALSGVGPALAAKLAKLHVHTLQDVLFHLPLRYEDRTSITEIGALLDTQAAVVIGEIELAQVTYGRRRSLVIRIADGTGFLTLRLFHFSQAQQKAFRRGFWVRCFGSARRGQQGMEMIHPEYRVFSEQPDGAMDERLTPVYPTTEGVSQALWRKITDQVLSIGLQLVHEYLKRDFLPAELRQAHEAASLSSALMTLHRPQPGTDLQTMAGAQTAAHQRLIFEELLAHHFSLRQARQRRTAAHAAALAEPTALCAQFQNNLPFQLTAAQQRVIAEIGADLQNHKPMMRLVQGDVGSGKTVVAAQAMLYAVAANAQTVLMAPTELLAEQHFANLSAWFADLGIAVGWLASKTPAAQKKATLKQLANGELLVAVGTHALIQDAVQYKNLHMVVIDEQHRFGVDQRLALREKTAADSVPHQLMMTATPIPRTLAMSFYADLDISSIDELPPGRKPIETVVMAAETRRQDVIERVRVACQSGRQVYWVCSLIDESEVLAAQAATDTEAELTALLPELRVGLVHGRLKTQEKEAVMHAFRDAEIDLLVATTVIEVGVDVPQASLMIIENAERMGLAQLHQLRGRVGRGSEQSYCILLYHKPLSDLAKQRLQIMRETQDGFVIAERDLEMRGAGELLGTRQTGAMSFKIADIIRDQHLLAAVATTADQVSAAAPEVIQPLTERWIGSREGYVNA